MRFVTFKDLVPGMVLHPVEDVNSPPEQKFLMNHIILDRKVEAGEEKFWGSKRAMYFLDLHDPHMGICSSSWRTGDDQYWEVVDDEEMLAKIRAYVKKEINDHRDQLDKIERIVDEHC